MLLYSATHSGYSLLDSLELLKLQLGRVNTALNPVPIWQFEPQKLDGMDYVVVLCPEPHALMTSNVIAALMSRNVPILWVGFGLEAGEQIAPLKGQVDMAWPEPNGGAEVPRSSEAQRIVYRSKEWEAGPFNYIETRLTTNSQAQTILAATNEANATNSPVCWKLGQLTFFAVEPQAGPLGFIFEDVLLDFFGVKDSPLPAFALRITGYVPRSNQREFKRMADFLHAHSAPFGVSIAGLTAEVTNSELGLSFIESLRYAQQRGGRIILEGSVANTAYWDTTTDRPLEQRTGTVRQEILTATEIALKAGLLPIGWQTPEYAASSDAYSEIAKIFGTAFERVQLSDATERQKYVAGGLTIDHYGRLIVPENLGFVANGTNDEIQTRAELLTKLRGTVMGCSIDAFQPLAKLIELVTLLEKYHAPFLDLADLGNRVELPNAILLTGDALATIDVRNATLRWKTFNRGGQLLAEDEQRTRVSGQRELKRIGIGVFELVQLSHGGEKQR